LVGVRAKRETAASQSVRGGTEEVRRQRKEEKEEKLVICLWKTAA
jgi:hypothetical protein